MNIKTLIGEVDGKDLINIGDVITVTTLKGREVYGRLNDATKEEIKVGPIRIKVENVIKVEKDSEGGKGLNKLNVIT